MTIPNSHLSRSTKFMRKMRKVGETPRRVKNFKNRPTHRSRFNTHSYMSGSRGKTCQSNWKGGNSKALFVWVKSTGRSYHDSVDVEWWKKPKEQLEIGSKRQANVDTKKNRRRRRCRNRRKRSMESGLVKMFQTSSVRLSDSRPSSCEESDVLYVPQNTEEDLESMRTNITQDFEMQWEEAQTQLLQNKRMTCSSTRKRRPLNLKPAPADSEVRMSPSLPTTDFSRLLAPEESEELYIPQNSDEELESMKSAIRQDFEREWQEAQAHLPHNESSLADLGATEVNCTSQYPVHEADIPDNHRCFWVVDVCVRVYVRMCIYVCNIGLLVCPLKFLVSCDLNSF